MSVDIVLLPTLVQQGFFYKKLKVSPRLSIRLTDRCFARQVSKASVSFVCVFEKPLVLSAIIHSFGKHDCKSYWQVSKIVTDALPSCLPCLKSILFYT